MWCSGPPIGQQPWAVPKAATLGLQASAGTSGSSGSPFAFVQVLLKGLPTLCLGQGLQTRRKWPTVWGDCLY